MCMQTGSAAHKSQSSKMLVAPLLATCSIRLPLMILSICYCTNILLNFANPTQEHAGDSPFLVPGLLCFPSTPYANGTMGYHSNLLVEALHSNYKGIYSVDM